MSNEPSPVLPRITPEEIVKQPWKFGYFTSSYIIAIVLAVQAGFNDLLFGAPPLQISKETTYITEPLTPDGLYIDYFAALENRTYPKEMQTDENGFRVLFRALGDFKNETQEFELIKQRYEKLGLDVNRDKPTMTYTEPEEFFKKRYELHSEEFEDIIAAERRKNDLLWKKELHQRIVEIEADSDYSTEEKEDIITHLRETIRWLEMTEKERREKTIMDIQPDIDEINNAPDLSDEEKAERIAELKQDAIDGMYYFSSSDLVDCWISLTQSPELHKNAVVQKWLEENNAALDLVAEQVNKPAFAMPYIKCDDSFALIFMPLPDFPAMRSLARGLSVRANIRIGEGDIDGAIGDILVCYRLGRHVEKGAMLVEGLVGIAIERIANAIPFGGNPAARANAEQLKRLQVGLATLSLRKGFVHKVESERFAFLDCMTDLMKGVPISRLSNRRGSIDGFETRMAINTLDWNLIFKKANGAYDDIESGTFDLPPPSRSLTQFLTQNARSNAFVDIFIRLWIPAVDAASEVWRHNECAMNLKRIVLAMHLYEREHGMLPPAFSVDANGKQYADGKPLHSWRTLLLPYFGDEELANLYAQIKLDEPWDSEHNRQFHARNLDVYRCPSSTLPDGDASYAVIVGDGLLFTDDGRGQTLAGHGRNMLMVVEHQESVCWMRPDAEITKALADLGIGSRRNTAPISSNHTGGCNFGLLDGAVTFISETIEETVFQGLVRGTAKERP